MRHRLLAVHRWVALIGAPVFLLITLTGVILAFRPILADFSTTQSITAVPTAQVIQLLEQTPEADKVRSVQVLDDNSTVRLQGVGDYNLATGERVGDASQSDPLQRFFGTVQDLHKSLLLQANWVMEIATYLMLGIVLAGKFLGLPKLGKRFNKTLIGWHQMLAWVTLPLVILIPFTAILMTLHIGAPELPFRPGSGAPSVVEALQALNQYEGGDQLISAGSFKSGAVMARVPEAQLIVTHQGVSPMSAEPYWPKELHEGTWAGAYSGALNAVAGSVLFALVLTGMISWIRRQRGARLRVRHAGAKTLVAFASQTGRALELARLTQRLLQQVGERADLVALGSLDAQALRAYRQVLLLVSTTGDGNLPDSLQGWPQRIESQNLSGVRFTLLALGDRGYANFCAGGRQVRQALLAGGAEELLPIAEADGDPRDVWQHWLQGVGGVLDLPLAVDAEPAGCSSCTARLLERVRLEHGDAVSESYGIKLAVPEGQAFSPGDLLSICLPNSGEERLYSIGSGSKLSPGVLQLTVGLRRYRDERGHEVLGRGSAELCLNWLIGEEREISIRPHPSFNPSEDDSKPMILIATGCGIAPFLGFVRQRASASGDAGPVWVLFGNRSEQSDFFYGDYLQDQLESGVLKQLDTVFSRDGGEERYITERLINRGEEFLSWLENGAQVYVCGRASTLGRSFETALQRILHNRGCSVDEARVQIEGWKRNGVLKLDLFG